MTQSGHVQRVMQVEQSILAASDNPEALRNHIATLPDDIQRKAADHMRLSVGYGRDAGARREQFLDAFAVRIRNIPGLVEAIRMPSWWGSADEPPKCSAVTERLRGSGVEGSKKEIKMRAIKYATATILAGALVSAAAASSAYAQYYYGPGYYPGYAYAYEPSYAYAAPAYPYAAPPVYGYVYVPPPTCWNSTSDSRNLGYYGSCAYGAIDTDAERLGQARPNRRLVR
jgi:hypothetical protein